MIQVSALEIIADHVGIQHRRLRAKNKADIVLRNEGKAAKGNGEFTVQRGNNVNREGIPPLPDIGNGLCTQPYGHTLGGEITVIQGFHAAVHNQPHIVQHGTAGEFVYRRWVVVGQDVEDFGEIVLQAQFYIEGRPVHVGEIYLLVGIEHLDVIGGRPGKETGPAQVADIGPHVEGGEVGRVVGVPHIHIRVDAYPGGQIHRRAAHGMGEQAYVQEQRHNILRIHTGAQANLVHGATFA